MMILLQVNGGLAMLIGQIVIRLCSMVRNQSTAYTNMAKKLECWKSSNGPWQPCGAVLSPTVLRGEGGRLNGEIDG